jgi:hypothetical protein
MKMTWETSRIDPIAAEKGSFGTPDRLIFTTGVSLKDDSMPFSKEIVQEEF